MANLLYKSPGLSSHSLRVICSFFLISLFCHGVAIFLVPDFLSNNRIRIIPVKYIRPLEINIRKIPPLRNSKAVSKSKKTKLARAKEESGFIQKRLRAMSVGKQLFLPAPAIQLPASTLAKQQEKIQDFYTSKSEPAKQFGQYFSPGGLPELIPDLKKFYKTMPSSSEADKSFSKEITSSLKKEIHQKEKVLSKKIATAKSRKKNTSNVKLNIEGPVTERKILSKPLPPRVTSEHTIRIKLKFWVTPNGIVDQILPIERGDTKLESTAIRYLKKWKFDPLSPNLKQDRQWGILTVKFLVR